MDTYHVFGLDIETEISLPELLPARSRGRACVSIRFGHVEKFQANVEGTQHQAGHGVMMFSYDGVARFRVSDGREVVVDAEPAAEHGLLRVCLLGPVIAAVLQQRGLLVLHASAVAVDGAAAVFLGGRGWGKSTLAASLRARGHDLLADDVVAVDLSGSAPRILPAFPQLKLWPASVEALGLDPESLPRLQQHADKRAYRFDGQFHAAPAPLERLYVLEVGDRLAIDSLPRRDAFAHLVRHTYLLKYLEGSGASATHFAQCAAVMRAAAVYRIVRPPSLALLEETATLLEEHACRPSAAQLREPRGDGCVVQ